MVVRVSLDIKQLEEVNRCIAYIFEKEGYETTPSGLLKISLKFFMDNYMQDKINIFNIPNGN